LNRLLLTLFLFLLFFQPVIHTASASALDDGINMVAQGIGKYEQIKGEEIIRSNFGVAMGNTSEIADYTASQKLVYMVAAATQNPFELEWVQKTFATELVWYMVIGVLIIIIIGGLNIVQKAFPEEVSGTYQMFTGNEGFFDYTATLKTTLKLGLMPILALPIIDTLLTLEQVLSSGLTVESLQFINIPAPHTAGIWLFEAIAYSVCGWLFVIRIQYINMFAAHILVIILLLCVTWSVTKYFGELFIAWFISALAMRPIVLWLSNFAVEDIARQQTETLAVAATIADMTAVVIGSFLIALVLVLWPVFMLLIKVISNYLLGTGYKIIKISNQVKMMRRN
jgi:hypothetical protein